MAKSLIEIDIIANDLCSDLGDSTYKNKAKFVRHILNGYRRLNMFLLPSKEVKTFVYQYANSINLPCNALYVTKVGVRRNGCIAMLTVTDSVPKSRLGDTECCNYLNSVWDGTYSGNGYTFYNAWGWDGNQYGELYGAGRSVLNNGTYSIDKQDGIIYLGGNIPHDAEIVVEVCTDGISGGVKLVPMETKECLEFYSKWKYYSDKNVTQSQINYNYFKKEYNVLKRFYNHMTPVSIASLINQSFSPSNY